MDFKSLVLVRNRNLAAQRVHCGKVKAKLGRLMTVRLPAPLVKAMCAMMLCGRRALDVLCQELHEAWSDAVTAR